MTSLNTFKSRLEFISTQNGLSLIKKCTYYGIKKDIDEFDWVSTLNNDSENYVRTDFIENSKRSVFNLPDTCNIRFSVWSGLSMKIFDFHSYILELIIVKVITCFTKNSSVTKTICILLIKDLLIRTSFIICLIDILLWKVFLKETFLLNN